jgi:hypothetical protein
MRPLALAALLTSACGASEPADERRSTTGETLFTSAGGERSAAEAPAPISTGPAPLPVPTTPVARGAMSPGLGGLWTRIEELLAETPPAPPEGAAVDAWVRDTLGPWMQQRAAEIAATGDRLAGLSAAPPYEQAVGAALYGALVEDFVADVRGAPVPPEVAADPELLALYLGSLDGMLGGIAEQAAVAYELCATKLDALGAPAWGEWRAFCFESAEGLAETYGDASAEDGGDD